MRFIRLVHPKNFDPVRKKFNDMAFKKSSGDGGMSIILIDCAEKNSASICAHIEAFYKGVGGDPPVFYFMDEAELPTGCNLKQTDSMTGDKDCHYEASGVSQGKMKAAFADKLDWKLFSTCDGGKHRNLTSSDVEAFPT